MVSLSIDPLPIVLVKDITGRTLEDDATTGDASPLRLFNF